MIQGDFGRVIIYSKLKSNMPVVPQSATQENQEGRYLYVLDENNLPRMMYIRTSGQTSDGKWIIAEGVKEGDRIVTSGLQKIIPGSPVRIVNAETQTQNAETKEPNFMIKLWNKIINK